MKLLLFLVVFRTVLCMQADETPLLNIDYRVLGVMAVGSLILAAAIWDHRHGNHFRHKILQKILKLKRKLQRRKLNIQLAGEQKHTINTFQVEKFVDLETSAAMDQALPSPIDTDSRNYNLQLPAEEITSHNLNTVFNHKKSEKKTKSKLRKKLQNNNTQLKKTEKQPIKESLESMPQIQQESNIRTPQQDTKSTEQSTQ